MTGLRWRRVLLLAVFPLLAGGAAAQSPPATWQWESGALTLRAGLDAQAWLYAMRGTWWNRAVDSAPTFDPDRSYGELWLLPKLSATYTVDPAIEAYGTASVGASRTLGADPFDYDNQGAVRFENAFVGLRGTFDGGWRYDLSVGRQPYVLGTGMLLAAGSSNGYSWGAGSSTPRKGWERAALARVGYGEFSAQGFALEPAEAPEATTNTRLQGLTVEWSRAEIGKAGLAWIKVPRSNAFYPGNLAPLAFIQNGRDGLDTWYGWFNAAGFVPGLPELGLRAEYAQQRNTIVRADGTPDPMRAAAWLLGVSYWAQSWWLAPRFSFHLARFSGDDPTTPTYERFDPLYWGNGLDNWWFGANGAYAWINANLRFQRAIVDAYASARDILQFQFVRASADQLNSAIQFGQGVRFDGGDVIVGVPTAHLSDEYYAQYARVISPQLTAIVFVAYSVPGDGLNAVATQGTRPWTTVGLGLTASF